MVISLVRKAPIIINLGSRGSYVPCNLIDYNTSIFHKESILRHPHMTSKSNFLSKFSANPARLLHICLNLLKFSCISSNAACISSLVRHVCRFRCVFQNLCPIQRCQALHQKHRICRQISEIFHQAIDKRACPPHWQYLKVYYNNIVFVRIVAAANTLPMRCGSGQVIVYNQ